MKTTCQQQPYYNPFCVSTQCQQYCCEMYRWIDRPTSPCLNEKKAGRGKGDNWYVKEDRVWCPGWGLEIPKEGIRQMIEKV